MTGQFALLSTLFWAQAWNLSFQISSVPTWHYLFVCGLCHFSGHKQELTCRSLQGYTHSNGECPYIWVSYFWIIPQGVGSLYVRSVAQQFHRPWLARVPWQLPPNLLSLSAHCLYHKLLLHSRSPLHFLLPSHNLQGHSQPPSLPS